jgi:hypothetical protein
MPKKAAAQVIEVANDQQEQPKKRTLDVITEELINAIVAGQGEWTELLAELDRELDGKALAYQIVAAKILAAVEGQKAQEKYHDEEAMRFKRRAAALKKEYDDMRERLGKSMRLSGKTEIVTVRGKLYFQGAPKVLLDSEDWGEKYFDQFPEYVDKSTTYKPKKTELLADYKSYKAGFIAAGMTDAEAEAAAMEQMPPGFKVDPNETLRGL